MPSLMLCTGFEHALNTSASWIKCNTGVEYADVSTYRATDPVKWCGSVWYVRL